jgi:hypothetical protein
MFKKNEKSTVFGLRKNNTVIAPKYRREKNYLQRNNISGKTKGGK